MKKFSLTILVLSITMLTFAQSGGSENQSQGSGDLENHFYLRFAYSHSSNTYLGVEDKEFWDDFKRYGGVFELGHIFIINKAPLADGLRLGINVDYAEFSYNQLAGQNADFDIGIPKLASKFGPSLSYRPSPKFIIDIFCKAKMTWVAGIIPFTDEVDDVYLGKPNMGIATGLNFRVNVVMFGFEYNYDNLKYESNDFPGEYFGNFTDDSDKTPMPTFSFYIGVCF